MKFGQLIGYNMTNIFLEKSQTKCDGEAIPRSFFKNIKLSISLNQQYKVLYSFFFIICQVEDYRNILKVSSRSFVTSSYKVFYKNKKRSKTSLPVSYSTWFLKKKIYIILFYYLIKFLSVCLYFIGQYVYCNCLLTWL